MTLVLLDLEATVIESWEQSFLFLPSLIAKIKVALDDAKESGDIVELGLASWAVWDDRDKAKFNQEIRGPLEALLDHAFDDRFVWSMDDWATELFKHAGKKMDRSDMFDLFGKEEVLMKVSRVHPLFQGKDVILFDDRVEHNMLLHSTANDCNLVFVNILQFIKE